MTVVFATQQKKQSFSGVWSKRRRDKKAKGIGKRVVSIEEKGTPGGYEN
jgi:hypothetical protein